jgi:hypothetical protein
MLVLRLSFQSYQWIWWFRPVAAVENPTIIIWMITYLDYLMYGVLLIIVMVPTDIVQILNFYMINIIRLVRQQNIMIEDYSTFYWLGLVNEVIIGIEKPMRSDSIFAIR